MTLPADTTTPTATAAAPPTPRHLADAPTAPAGVHPANPAAYLKAIAGAVLAGLGVLYVALNDGTVTAQEWVEIAQAALIAGAGVYGIPNIKVG